MVVEDKDTSHFYFYPNNKKNKKKNKNNTIIWCTFMQFATILTTSVIKYSNAYILPSSTSTTILKRSYSYSSILSNSFHRSSRSSSSSSNYLIRDPTNHKSRNTKMTFSSSSLSSNNNPIHDNDILSSPIKKNKAMLVESTIQNLESCAARLLEDKLVSFPTETVYGLGANGLSEQAAHKIFMAKGRPKTSPLILHVLSTDDAMKLWDTTSSEGNNDILVRVLQGLCKTFFPGPLTIISKANMTVVPSIITANTGYVAIRSPSHPIARQLLTLAGIPIAAPSANKFGHVSPTKADHVLADLKEEDVWIVEEDEACLDENKEGKIGVESTVAKVDAESYTISILRHGAVSAYDIQECVLGLALGEEHVFTINNQVQTIKQSKDPTNNTTSIPNQVSPGQTIRHYAPNIPCFIIAHDIISTPTMATTSLTLQEIELLQKSIIIDYGKILYPFKSKALYYKDLSPSGNIAQATQCLFDTLRWAENVAPHVVTRIFVPEIVLEQGDVGVGSKHSSSLVLALKDRLTRAASGVIIHSFQ